MMRLGLGLMSLLLLLCGPVTAHAQTVPTKTITFYNNSTDRTLYPVIQAPIMSGANVRDLWLQAQFNVPNVATQIFNTTLLYRIYINRTNGVPPGGSVTVTLPFYTQLLPANAGNLGKVNDQFVDWWNAMRFYIFDGKDAADAGYNYSVSRTGAVIPPIPVNPVAGAALPSCSSGGSTCEPLRIVAYVNGFPPSVPAQLVEYTLAAAQGPPLNPTLAIDRSIVNFNISAVDQVYLPAAIGAHGNTTAQNAYLGSTRDVASFRSALAAFTNGGALWPYYVPAYYTAQNPTIPLPTPPAGGQAYPQPQIPSAETVYAESYRNPPPAPPVLSSDTLSGRGVLGQVAQGTLDLWTRCTSATPPQSTTCTKIQTVSSFFTSVYQQCFPGQPLPATPTLLQSVYGWVPPANCTKALVSVPGYDTAIHSYCDLQYNFFDPTVPASDVFNPYVKLVHQSLASNAYAFSIDDAVSFKSLPGDGVVITVAGTNGLANPTQTPLPTAATYHTYCEGGSAGLGGPPLHGWRFTPALLKHYRVLVHLPVRPDWGKGVVRKASGPLVTVRFAKRGTVTVDTRSALLSIISLTKLGKPVPQAAP